MFYYIKFYINYVARQISLVFTLFLSIPHFFAALTFTRNAKLDFYGVFVSFIVHNSHTHEGMPTLFFPTQYLVYPGYYT